MSKKKLVPIMLLIFIIAPFSACFAVPVLYTVNGQAVVGDGVEECIVSGEMYIDDAVQFTDLGGSAVFTYSIPTFSLSIGSYAFMGSGAFYSHYYQSLEANSSFTCPHDGSYLVGEGDWSNMYFLDYGTNFYFPDDTAFDKGTDFSDFLNVPYKIYSDFICSTAWSEGNSAPLALFNFEITQNANTAPVPEPSTFILFGLGIVAFSTKWRTLRNNKKSNSF